MAMASSRILLLLAAILLSMASVQVRSDDSPPPPPAPSSLPAGGQCTNACTNDYLFELERCFPLVQEKPRPRNYKTEDCFQQLRGKPSAGECLCAAFRRNRDALPRIADFHNTMDYVFIVCDEDDLPDLDCPASLTA